MDSWPVELRIFERVIRADVLVEDPERQNRLRRVEKIVNGNEKRLEKCLEKVKRWREKEKKNRWKKTDKWEKLH